MTESKALTLAIAVLTESVGEHYGRGEGFSCSWCDGRGTARESDFGHDDDCVAIDAAHTLRALHERLEGDSYFDEWVNDDDCVAVEGSGVLIERARLAGDSNIRAAVGLVLDEWAKETTQGIDSYIWAIEEALEGSD